MSRIFAVVLLVGALLLVIVLPLSGQTATPDPGSQVVVVGTVDLGQGVIMVNGYIIAPASAFQPSVLHQGDLVVVIGYLLPDGVTIQATSLEFFDDTTPTPEPSTPAGTGSHCEPAHAGSGEHPAYAILVTMRTTASYADATLHDLPGLYRVCRLTGDGGHDASGQYSDPDLLGHVWAGPYAVGPRAVALVVHDDAGVAGYCLGAPDTLEFEEWLNNEWFPPLRQRYPRDQATAGDQWLIDRIHAWPPTDPELLATYPAHLHIDLLPRLQGQGWGRRLITELGARLHAAGAGGIHLGVNPANAAAIAFYERLGFHVVKRTHEAVIYGAALGPAGLVTTGRPESSRGA